jgi:chloride channel 7
MDGHEHDGPGLLGRSITFNSRRRAAGPPAPADGTETLMTRVFGSQNVPNQRVSESLDYEPVQNKIFYERMRQAKKERHLFG